MTTYLSSLSSLNTLINNIRDNKYNLDKIGAQVSTGKVSPDLADIAKRSQLLDLNETKAQTDAYSQAIQSTQLKADGTDSALTRIISAANTLISAIDSYQPNSVTANTKFITSAVTTAANEFTASLNTRVGDTYIFAGSRYGTQPVNANNVILTAAQLAAAPYNGAAPASISALGTAAVVTAGGGTSYPVAATANGSPPHLVADYDSNFTGYTNNDDPNNLAFTKQSITVEDSRRVTYGITSNDQVFQDFAFALRAAQTGAASTAAAPVPTNWLQLARTALSNVVSTLQGKQAALGESRADMAATLTRHQTDSSNLDISISKITDVDPAKASTDLLSIQTQYQGTLSVTKTSLGLSLVNYLR